MLQESDFVWLVRHKNNIAENPIDCYYCVVDQSNGAGKMYMVEPMYTQDTNGVMKMRV